MGGKFEVYQHGKGEFRFRKNAGKGRVIATGEGYRSKKACMNAVASIRKNAGDATVVDQTT